MIKSVKPFLISLGFLLSLISCENHSDLNGNESGIVSEESGPEQPENIYEKDWLNFKESVIAKDKDAVLFFVSKQDQALMDVLDLSYDYVFDDQMIEEIEYLNYSDLPVSAMNDQWKELNVSYETESDGEIYESGTYLYFEERPEGLRIVNFLAAG